MKAVEFFNFTIPPNVWSKKPYPSRHKMTMEEAAKRHPGAQPILNTREVRNVPETREELSMHSSIQPHSMKKG